MTRTSLLTRIRQYESEIVHRSTPRVLDSRKAAAWYHSPAASELGSTYGLGNIGLRPGETTVRQVLEHLEMEGINASNIPPEMLETRVREAIRGIKNNNDVDTEASLRRRQVKKRVDTVPTDI